MALPDELKTPVTNIDEAYAWIRGLIRANMMFHFDDGPEDCVIHATGEDLFSDPEKLIVRARLDEVYEVYDWGQEICPIGVSLMMETFGDPDMEPLADIDAYRLRGQPRADFSIVCWAEGEPGLVIADRYIGYDDDEATRFEVQKDGAVLGVYGWFADALAYVQGA